MEQEGKSYVSILSHIIEDQVQFLGPAFAYAEAKKVKGIIWSSAGKIERIERDEVDILKELVDVYATLLGESVKKSIDSVFKK